MLLDSLVAAAFVAFASCLAFSSSREIRNA
jgi:hypothetical protein